MTDIQEQPPSKPPSSSSAKTWAAVVGITWMSLSGLCTASYAVPAFFSSYYLIGLFGLVIGAAFIGFGYVILRYGFRK